MAATAISIIKSIQDLLTKYCSDYKVLRNFDAFNLSKLFALGITGYDEKKTPIIDVASVKAHGNQEILSLAEYFQANSKGLINSEEGAAEMIAQWEGIKMAILHECHEWMSDTMKIWRYLFLDEIRRDRYKGVLSLVQVALVIAPHSADCERGFSKMNIIKSKLRNLLGED